MKCKITKSKHYGDYCKKRACTLFPCSQLVLAHREKLRDVVTIKQKIRIILLDTV